MIRHQTDRGTIYEARAEDEVAAGDVDDQLREVEGD